MSQLNEALRLIRVFHDKKIKELADKIGVSSGYISDIEKNKKKPSMDIIQKYADYFNTTPSALLFFAEELDEEKCRNPFKLSIRNKMLKFLQAIEEKTIGKDE